MAFDIRKAQKLVGVIPPQHTAEEKKMPEIADVDDKGEVDVKPFEDYGGDIILAGYMEFLEKNDITKDDIKDVLDSLITTENVEWSFKLFNRIPVSFVVRPAWVDNYISECIDDIMQDSERVSNIRYNNLIAECNLAASLRRFKDKEYVINNVQELEMARKRIQDMSYVVQNALVRKLAVFDRTIVAATSDWAIKNFTSPQQEG